MHPSATRFAQFSRHMSGLEDPVLVTLKGHLLVEELLEALIRLKCRAPEHLKHARLGFYQKAALARALIGSSHENGLILPESFWPLVLSLNELRNDLAHQLESSKRIERIERFIAHAQITLGSDQGEKALATGLRRAVEYLLGFLACFEEVVRTGEVPPRIENDA